MTVLEVIQKSAEFLSGKGVESPRLQAELLLAHVLKLPRMKLYLNFERGLSQAELTTLREFVKRRGQREPLQHITGSTSFCGLEMVVNRNVLVPRPETELLAERGWEFLQETSRARQAHAGPETGAPTALDFGTGSGCIAIALATKCPGAAVLAVDASAEALAVAEQNVARHQLADRIELRHCDGFGALAADTRFDLIISNPPYIPNAEIATLQPEVRDFDPHAALDGGADGLEFYRRLAMETMGYLQTGGRIMLELGDGQAEAVTAIFKAQAWVVESVLADYASQPRILIARRD